MSMMSSIFDVTSYFTLSAVMISLLTIFVWLVPVDGVLSHLVSDYVQLS